MIQETKLGRFTLRVNKIPVYILLASALFLNGCMKGMLQRSPTRITVVGKITPKHSILVKVRDVDRLEVGRKITAFLKEQGYNATLSIQKQNKSDFVLLYDYTYLYDAIHYTFRNLDIVVRDSETNSIIINAQFGHWNAFSADTLLQNDLKVILEKMKKLDNASSPSEQVK